jgi:hypothetical protein
MALLAGTAAAETQAMVLRTGEHPGFGRIVLELPGDAHAGIEVSTGRVAIRLANPVGSLPARLPHNVRSLERTASGLSLSLAPGVRLRQTRLANRVVLDLLDAPATHAQHGAVSSVNPSGPLASVHASPPGPVHRETPSAPAVTELPPIASPAVERADQRTPSSPVPTPTVPATPIPPQPTASEPLAIAASLATLPPGETGRAMTVPFAANTAAAAFRRGDTAVVVFDERRPIDLAPLQGDPVFSGASTQLLPAATVVRVKLRASLSLRLERVPAGWTVIAVPESEFRAPRPIRPEAETGRLRLPAEGPGQVVSVPDPETGSVLSVGTQRVAGQGFVVGRSFPDVALLPTWQGVAMEPLSDAATLRSAPGQFVVEALGEGRTLALAAPDPNMAAEGDAANFSRRYDLPFLSTVKLRQRLRDAVNAAASAPAQARGPRRLEVAQALLALGLGAEAQSLVTLATTEDGRLADDPQAAGLAAIASLLAGRLSESGAIEDARLSGSNEVTLWRAVRAATQDETSPAAASLFTAELPLLLAYPPPLRDRLLPLAAEVMVRGGERAAARHLVDARPEDKTLDFARGLLAEADGARPDALYIMDKLAQSPDRLIRARAAARAVELRLASGTFTPAQAADAFEGLFLAWRSDERERALRLRAAELRRQSRAWRPALALLRETAEICPERRDTIHTRLADTFAAALAEDGLHPLPPLDLVALAEENPDLLPPGDAGQQLAARLGERLMKLDLPRRAEPVFEKLVNATPQGAAQAEFGARLAALRLENNNPAGALEALSASAADKLPSALSEARTLVYARAAAQQGSLTSAVAALAALDTPTGDELRASLLEQAKEWPAAEAALQHWAARVVPSEGQLDETQSQILLRLASAAAQAGDDTLLQRLRAKDSARLADGPAATLFRVITETAVEAPADLPRAAQEAALAGKVPQALRSLVAGVGQGVAQP